MEEENDGSCNYWILRTINRILCGQFRDNLSMQLGQGLRGGVQHRNFPR